MASGKFPALMWSKPASSVPPDATGTLLFAGASTMPSAAPMAVVCCWGCWSALGKYAPHFMQNSSESFAVAWPHLGQIFMPAR